MNGYYDGVKSKVGIDDQMKKGDENNELDDVLRTLKPKTAVKNFREFQSVD